MTTHQPSDPRLERTASGELAYQSRTLAHQDEPLVDQGAAFDITTLLSRRGALSGIGATALAVGLAACGTDGSTDASTDSASDGGASDGTATASTGEIPEETNGPYPADGTNGVNVLTESGIVRSDIRSSFGTGSASAEGVPMTLTLTLTNLADGNAPYEGAAVYVWHCNAGGEYSLYSTGLENENYLRGVQIADADGTVEFTSIFPGCYSGRWPHIHFEVYPDAASITDYSSILATSQVALPQDVCESVYALPAYDGSAENLAQITLATDNVFGDDGGELQLGSADGDTATGWAISLPVAIDPETDPGTSMGAAPAGGGASDGGGPGGSGGPGAGGQPPSGGGPSDGGTPPSPPASR